MDSTVKLEDVLHVKREMENEVKHIHHMQTVVIDLQEKGYVEHCHHEHEQCHHEHEHCHHEHEHCYHEHNNVIITINHHFICQYMSYS